MSLEPRTDLWHQKKSTLPKLWYGSSCSLPSLGIWCMLCLMARTCEFSTALIPFGPFYDSLPCWAGLRMLTIYTDGSILYQQSWLQSAIFLANDHRLESSIYTLSTSWDSQLPGLPSLAGLQFTAKTNPFWRQPASIFLSALWSASGRCIWIQHTATRMWWMIGRWT